MEPWHHAYLIDHPTNVVLTDKMIEDIVTIYPYYCNYLLERDPIEPESYLYDVMDLEFYEVAIEFIEQALGSVPDCEKYFNGGCVVDFTLTINMFHTKMEFIGTDYEDNQMCG